MKSRAGTSCSRDRMTTLKSETLRRVGPIKEEWMREWMKQWAF
jgi:hypothetical protein